MLTYTSCSTNYDNEGDKDNWNLTAMLQIYYDNHNQASEEKARTSKKWFVNKLHGCVTQVPLNTTQRCPENGRYRLQKAEDSTVISKARG